MRPFFTSLIAVRSELYRLLFGVLIGLIGASTTSGQSLPVGFNVNKTGDGYSQPTGLTFNGQQQFVWDKAGRVWVSTWNGTQYVKQTTPVLNIAPEVGNWRDLGLLSVALDPNFAQNGFVYLFYSVDRHHLINFGTTSYNANTDTYFSASICRLTRYRLIQTNGVFTTDYASRKILIGETKSTGVPIVYEAHAGGTILFGRDGSLLLSTGDNAGSATPDKGSSPGTYYQQALTDSIITPAENVGSFRSQMLTSLCGKVLRIDPNTGDGIASNPFYEGNNPRSARSRVWALGFRSAFRMTLQGGTGSTNPADGNPGTLLVGDVGSGIWEDLHIIRAAGENAGWPMYEGITPSYNFPDIAKTLENKDEPNTDATCNKPFLTFADLLRPAPVSATAVATSPCGTTPLPGPQRRYFHSPPALDWNHGAPNARTPTFSGTVATATTISLNSTACAGNPFSGVCAIGGAWYPSNAAFPTTWHNTLFFADYGSNWIRAATLNGNGGISQVREFLPDNGGNGIVDVAYNPLDGNLYYLNLSTGEVKKISYGGNQPPVVVATANPQTGSSPLSVTFTGSNSSDPDGDPLTYEWTFSDGATSTVANPVRVFSSAPDAQGVLVQTYTAQLAVTDSKGLRTVSPLIRISLDNLAPTARITTPVDNATYPLDRASSYTLAATVTDDNVAGLTYAWQVTLRHNTHEHREPIQTTASPTITISPVGCDGETYYYLVKLTVTDAGGLTASDSVKIYPDCNSANLAISTLQATTLTNSVQLNWTNPTIPFDNVLVVAKAGSGFSDRPLEVV
ncbi:MAG: PKD domain-containing protein [Cytophagales bacterium]|nr:MAG: PKD domain-containing protein [Cytophagales bacterium]